MKARIANINWGDNDFEVNWNNEGDGQLVEGPVVIITLKDFKKLKVGQKIIDKLNEKREGIYETEYGNAAYVPSNDPDQAYDLDMAEWIPIEVVTDIWIREADDRDKREL